MSASGPMLPGGKEKPAIAFDYAGL